jgi:photosystem II stability/assembly factor-like uncharacterized protein
MAMDYCSRTGEAGFSLDIEGFDANTAVIMAVAEPAIILRTIDAGKTWKTVFSDSRPGMFLDAMDFMEPGAMSLEIQ